MRRHRLDRLARLTQGAAVLTLGVLAAGCEEKTTDTYPHTVNSPPQGTTSARPEELPASATAQPAPSASAAPSPRASASGSAAAGAPGAPALLNSPNAPQSPFPGTMNVRTAEPPAPKPAK